MKLGYNTNGFAHHRLEDAIAILAELGYAAIALTPDVAHLPFDENQYDDTDAVRALLEHHQLACVVETGARFLLDPRRKHQPTLISPDPEDRAFRRDVLEDHIDLAHSLGAEVVSLWSGASLTDETENVLMARLADECRRLADHAATRGIRLAFEPEPGMMIDTMARFAELYVRVNHPHFGLTLDVGHLVCSGEPPATEFIATWRHVLWNVHLDDMRPGVHDHLRFGEGVVDFTDLAIALEKAKFNGIASVELSRHSYDAVNVATQSIAFWKSITPAA